MVGQRFALAPGVALNFYDFGSADDVAHLTKTFRAGLDQSVDDEIGAQLMVDEACAAFVRHRELFEQLALAQHQ